tara:strand:+ start:317 stop:1474 length:1158 start_codon:yes stop_codon:yes gene_type:complete
MPEVTKKVLEEKLGKKQAAKQWSKGFDTTSQETQGGVTDEGSAMKALKESIEKVTPEEAKESYKKTQDIVDKLKKDKGEGIKTLPAAIIADVKENLSGIKTPNWMTPSFALNLGIAGAKGIEALLDKVFKPSVEDFNDPVVLASINRLFEEKNKELGEVKGEEFKTNYLKKYADKMKEAFDPQFQFEQEQGFGLTGDATGIASLFDDKLAKSAADAKSGKLGKGVQRINFPEEFYTGSGARLSKGKIVMPQTTGELENLAGLDASQHAGTDLAQMIFDARAELDRQQGGQGGGGGAGIMGAVPTPFTDVNNNGILDNLEVAPVAPPPATTTPGVPSLTPTTNLTPTSIDYTSMAPQFRPQYPGYLNQGVASPQFGDWYQNLNRYT